MEAAHSESYGAGVLFANTMEPGMRQNAMRIGTLDDDLTSLAGAIHGQAFNAHRMVWIDDRKRVFVGDPDSSPLLGRFQRCIRLLDQYIYRAQALRGQQPAQLHA
jgi:hypothetical protein